MRFHLPASRLPRRLLLPLALAWTTLGCPAAASEPSKSPITNEAYDALWSGDFARLEQRYAYYRQPGRFEPDGTSQLDLFRRGIADVFNAQVADPERYLKELDMLTLQWATEHPRSVLAHLLHARSLLAHAHSYRGSGFANQVPPHAWADYHNYLRQAASYLGKHAELALTDSYAYFILLEAGKGLSWPDKQMASIAAEGVKRNPEDIVIHEAMANRLLPKWGGHPKALDDYIKLAAEQTRAVYGSGMYAMLYATAAEQQYGNDLFQNSHADWDKMKQGFEDLLTRFPQSMQERNRYAYMACIAGDRATLLRLLGEIGTQVRPGAWGHNGKRAFETCRRMATQL